MRVDLFEINSASQEQPLMLLFVGHNPPPVNKLSFMSMSYIFLWKIMKFAAQEFLQGKNEDASNVGLMQTMIDHSRD